MSIRSADTIERSVHKANEWLSDLAAELGDNDREDAWRILRAYLHVLRDELTIDEAAQLAAQLPLVLRGAFYEGFDPGNQDKARHGDEFLSRFSQLAQLPDPDQATQAVEAATRVLRRHITRGEWGDVLAQLPTDVRKVLLRGARRPAPRARRLHGRRSCPAR
jgi:uncharacterized protein (DUF2267 family)